VRKKLFGLAAPLFCCLALVVITLPTARATGETAQQSGLARKRGTRSAPVAAKDGDTGQAAVPAEVTLAIDRLRARGALKRARLNRRTGRAAALYGDLGALPRRDAAEAPVRAAKLDVDGAAVLDYLGEHADLTGIASPGRDLKLERRVDGIGATHFYFRQTVGALGVFDAETSVHVDRSGQVFALTSEFTPDMDPSLATVSPVLGESVAREVAIDALGAIPAQIDRDEYLSVELGIAPVDRGRLAWRVFVPVREPGGAWEVFVDALTGQAIGEPRAASYNKNRANVFVPNAVVATGQTDLRDQADDTEAVPGSAYTQVKLRRLDGSGAIQGPFVTTAGTPSRVRAADGEFPNLTRNKAGFEEFEVYWAISHAQRYIQRDLGIQNAGNYQIRVNCHFDNQDNSFYTRSGNGTGNLKFGDGGVDDAEDAEIIWHEYGHAVLDNQRPNIVLGGEGGAIHEGWGDYLAATLSTTVPGDARFYPAIGEWDAVSYNPGDPAYLRRVDGNKQYPEDIVRQVHEDGEIWSACLWGIHNALGRRVADPIIFNANFLFPQDVEFADAAAAVLQSDSVLNGGANAAAIRAVFARHGLAGDNDE
jgi:Zn-dependent metalloprotease